MCKQGRKMQGPFGLLLGRLPREEGQEEVSVLYSELVVQFGK
jgi:hypothetical protein